MTKQNYIELAKLIKENQDKIGDDWELENTFIIHKEPFLMGLCEILKSDNPRFNEETFRKACE